MVLDNENEHVIEAVLEWLYKGEYSYPEDVHELYKGKCDEPPTPPANTSEPSCTHPGRMLFDADVFTAADKLIITKLKDHAASKFGPRCKTGWASKEFASAITKVYEFPIGFHAALKHRILFWTVPNATELLCNRTKYPAFHDAMGSSIDFSGDLAINLAHKPPQKVVVNKPVDRPIDRPVDRIVYMNDPTMIKYQCPRCHQLFSVGPTPTPQTRYGCPRACVGHNDAQWWAQHVRQ